MYIKNIVFWTYLCWRALHILQELVGRPKLPPGIEHLFKVLISENSNLFLSGFRDPLRHTQIAIRIQLSSCTLSIITVAVSALVLFGMIEESSAHSSSLSCHSLMAAVKLLTMLYLEGLLSLHCFSLSAVHAHKDNAKKLSKWILQLHVTCTYIIIIGGKGIHESRGENASTSSGPECFNCYAVSGTWKRLEKAIIVSMYE